MNPAQESAALSEAEEPLPPPPERGDCCNGGCAVCVLEGYDEEVERWQREVDAITARNEQRRRKAVGA